MKRKNNLNTKIFSDVCNEWLCMKRLTVKESTYAKYYETIRCHILPDLGNLSLAALTSAQMNHFLYSKMHNGRIQQSGPLAPKTVRDIYAILKSILNYASQEYQFNNIMQNISLPKKETPAYEILTRKEQDKLVDSILEDMGHLRKAGILICLYTGLRLGEICALRWKDVDFDKKLIYVRHTLQRISSVDRKAANKTRLILDSPKTKTSIRSIPLNTSLLVLFRKMGPATSPDAFVLTNRKDCVEPRNYQYFFHTYLKEIGIRSVNFHILRHTFASRCVESGFDIKILSELLGHSSASITLNHYIHASMENKRKHMNMLQF